MYLVQAQVMSRNQSEAAISPEPDACPVARLQQCRVLRFSMQAFRMLLLSCALAVAAAFTAPAGQAIMCPSVPRQAAVSMTAATKPMRTNERRRAYNKMYKSEMKTMIKKVSNL
eukprot:6038248-Pleurochrysis_carterae.AAC.2